MLGKFPRNRCGAVFMIVMAFALAAGAVWFAREAAALLDTRARASGTVIELRRETGSRGMRVDHPIVRFTVPGTARTVVFRSRIGLWPSPFSVGETVEVAYEPARPEKADIVSFWTIWLPSVGLLLFAALCLAAGLHTLRSLRRVQAPAGG